MFIVTEKLMREDQVAKDNKTMSRFCIACWWCFHPEPVRDKRAWLSQIARQVRVERSWKRVWRVREVQTDRAKEEGIFFTTSLDLDVCLT